MLRVPGKVPGRNWEDLFAGGKQRAMPKGGKFAGRGSYSVGSEY
jgi:hypothetical protein